jgi:hypothetical protein
MLGRAKIFFVQVYGPATFNLGTQLMGGYVDPIPGLKATVKRKISASIENRIPVAQYVTTRITQTSCF